MLRFFTSPIYLISAIEKMVFIVCRVVPRGLWTWGHSGGIGISTQETKTEDTPRAGQRKREPNDDSEAREGSGRVRRF